jgi:hypothetical protein
MPCGRPACPRELHRSDWLGKQESLHQIETQLAHGEEISPGFDTPQQQCVLHSHWRGREFGGTSTILPHRWRSPLQNSD